MSAATLLHLGPSEDEQTMFAFDHAMSHRNYFGAMFPLTRFSVIPYLLDPLEEISRPTSPWHLNHQQAHFDATSSLPQQYGFLPPRFAGAPENALPVGVFTGQFLSDYDIDDEDQRLWWTFANNQEHRILDSSVLPGPTGDFTWTFPFW